MTAPRPCIELTKLELSWTVVRPKSTDGVCDGLCACTNEGMEARAKTKMALLRERFIVVYVRGETRIAHAVTSERSQVNAVSVTRSRFGQRQHVRPYRGDAAGA